MNPMQDNASSYSRRKFLSTAGMSVVGLTLAGKLLAGDKASTLEVSPEVSPVAAPTGFTVQPLDYSFDALEPHIDARTMEIHHGKHYAGYVNNLNKALLDSGTIFPATIEALIGDLDKLPETLRTTIRNNGGGAANHELFWNLLSPKGGGQPKGYLGNAIDAAYGSFDKFQESFAKAATSRFGSGWAWLGVNAEGALYITSTPNQDSLLMRGVVEQPGKPILGLDVWEHAYYLHYQNRRADYIKAFWNLVNWETAEELYVTATH
ncbi:MAG: superoxide dismutase [Verrucomicrobiota bacterium]|nr:superoxide dismutase [Verrucomicrobiota bacterium]